MSVSQSIYTIYPNQSPFLSDKESTDSKHLSTTSILIVSIFAASENTKTKSSTNLKPMKHTHSLLSTTSPPSVLTFNAGSVTDHYSEMYQRTG